MKYKKITALYSSSSSAPQAQEGKNVIGSLATTAFLPWQPSTWPDPPTKIDTAFISALEKIFKESILEEIEKVIEDVRKSNGDLRHRGHVVALALMCALDAISAYGYGHRSQTYMADFIANHFPPEFKPHANREAAPGVVLDFDDEGHVVGIDIDHASKIIDLSRLEAEALPITSLALTKR